MTEPPTPPARCALCARKLHPTEQQTCQTCIGETRTDLYDVLRLYRLLPASLGQLGSNAPRDRYASTERPTPGRDALVLLAGGSNGHSQIRGAKVGDRRDDTHERDEWPTDVPSVAWALARWEDDWRRQRGERAADGPPDAHAAFTYLAGPRLGWAAAHHPEFAEFARDMKTLAAILRTRTGTNSPPVYGLGPDCFNCPGVRIARYWTDKGLEDVWRCKACGKEYDGTAYMLAHREQLERRRTEIT